MADPAASGSITHAAVGSSGVIVLHVGESFTSYNVFVVRVGESPTDAAAAAAAAAAADTTVAIEVTLLLRMTFSLCECGSPLQLPLQEQPAAAAADAAATKPPSPENMRRERLGPALREGPQAPSSALRRRLRASRRLGTVNGRAASRHLGGL